jgi:hypothetical protein
MYLSFFSDTVPTVLPSSTFFHLFNQQTERLRLLLRGEIATFIINVTPNACKGIWASTRLRNSQKRDSETL